MSSILGDIRVVEMGTYITGPAAAMQLADLGADVVKVERPVTGDPFRAFNGGLYSPHYQTYNRNKRSIALDTSIAEDRDVFYRLIARSDVFIQNFRPGVAERLGVGWDDLKAVNPRLVYCAITGFGSSGPAKDRPAFDTVAQAASGFLRLMTPPESPRVIGPAIADAITGYYAAQGITAALLAVRRTGEGMRLDISMLEAMCHFNLDSFTHYFSMGEIMGPLSRPAVSQSYTFKCADAKWLAIHMSSPEKFWHALVETVELPELLTDPRFSGRGSRIEHQDELIEILTPVFLTRTRQEWCSLFEQKEVPHSPAYDANEALSDPQAVHLHIQVETTHPETGLFRTVRPPYNFDGRPRLDVMAPPTLDQHGDEIRAELASTQRVAE